MEARYKTRMCNKIGTEQGCPFGDKCTFAHTREELRNERRHKTRMCKYGDDCKFGDRCTFAHSREELRLEKSQLCKKVFHIGMCCKQKLGMCNKPKCTYGAKCYYAHSQREMEQRCDDDDCPFAHSFKQLNTPIEDSVCQDDTCQYAHSKEELTRPSDARMKISDFMSSESSKIQAQVEEVVDAMQYDLRRKKMEDFPALSSSSDSYDPSEEEVEEQYRQFHIEELEKWVDESSEEYTEKDYNREQEELIQKQMNEILDAIDSEDHHHVVLRRESIPTIVVP